MRWNSIYKNLKRKLAFTLAVLMFLQVLLPSGLGGFPAEAATEGRGTIFYYYNTGNLLKPGSSFPFYGKDHNRVGLWPYGITNVEGEKSAAGFCLEPNKSMRTGTEGTLVSYDLDLDGDNLPLGLTREEAEILWYALSSCGNFEGYQDTVGKMGQGHYILGQAATWAIMSGRWAGVDDFREQMEVLLANLQNPRLAAETRGALEQFYNQANSASEQNAVPPFASKYMTTAPVHQMEEKEDGSYSITLKFSEDFDWRQSTLVYDLPDGWEMVKENDGVTFICNTGNPDIGLVRGHFPAGSTAAQYWIKPNTFKIWFPDGWDETSAVEGKQAMITMAGEQEEWEVWLSFGKGTTTRVEGDYEIPYTQYLHEETFKRDYKIELEKLCDETGKPLEGASFEILEQFDFSQLDRKNLEEEQFRKESAFSEGKFENLNVCQSSITTDENGHFEHSDQKTYDYEKTYCGGHPDPIIHYVEVSDDASEEESAAAEEENERLEEEAWAAWQACVDWCEENCDFHSIDEGVARDEMEADRDEAWDTFIHLKRIYTVREIQARTGYILHDLHSDDIPVEIVEFASSQADGDGTVIGSYPGNARSGQSVLRIATPSELTISPKVVPVVQAAATPSNAESENAQEENPGKEPSDEDMAGNKEESGDSAVPDRGTGNQTESSVATDSEINLDRIEGEENLATPSNAMTFSIQAPSFFSEEEGGNWTWDGVQEESEVAPINQQAYVSDKTGYTFVVRDHRTEGELHINKRDMELYEADEDESYGKSQADATLEGAVYGLYAAEDIIHPDGKTGKVFSSGELVAIAATDRNGDASFLVITEESETSRNVPNLYDENQTANGNCWIGRPLILGSYYVEEISRSEGYELSRTGKNLSESNRTGKPVVLTASGSASTDGFYHEINEWDGNSYDFTVDYYDTKGFDVYLSGLPENLSVYEVITKETTRTEDVITGTERVEAADAEGNPIYETAKGGEYKLDAEGNKVVKQDADGNPLDSDTPSMKTVRAVNRLNAYIPEITREEPSDMDLEESEDIDPDYILWETYSALSMSGYKTALTEAPWTILPLSGDTNGEMIEEILESCASDSFWDAYDVEEVFEQDGAWYAKIRYGYQAIKEASAVYERGSGRLAVRQEYESGYYYAIYEKGEYEQDGYTFTIEEKKLDETAFKTGKLVLQTKYVPLYETYAAGEILLDTEGNPIPKMVAKPIYSKQEITEYEETLNEIAVSYDKESGRFIVSADTSDETFEDQKSHTKVYRVAAKSMDSYQNAAVGVSTQKEALDEGSYVKYALLLYPGQYAIYEDAGTRQEPVIVEQRVIKQAIKVTKDIALDSYENNTYEIHRDPFTVLFGGYNGKEETKTLPGFFFKLYLRSDLLDTGKLTVKEDGSYDYEQFFKENPEYASSLALEWDTERHDADGDMTTVHANQGGGKDDYWGESRMLPYGTYVLVEQQPTGIPQKHYQIDTPKEIEIPFIPQVDGDGTVHDKIPSAEYLYDAEMTPEELMERYFIRFNEETHIIKAHNDDGDFEVFKYGLEPDMARDCQNDAVAAYYHYGSISENAGTADHVYYETYYDRNGAITDYGVTLDNVATMTGKSTAVDRKFAKALIPWSVLDPRYGEVINDDGDIGNREPGLEEDGSFNFISFANEDVENEFYSSRLRIEKIDSETGENIIHEGALFKIYAAKRDISGDGADNVTGTGDVLFDENGIPLYDENEQIFMQDASGAEVGVFKAYTTIRDGEVEHPDGTITTEKQCVGYIETYQPLGAGAYVLVEVEPPAGYVKSKPIAFTVYSDKVEYYEDGDAGKKVQAVKYQYIRPIGSDGKTVVEDLHQIVVKDQPTHVEIHKLEKQQESITYRVDGDEEQLKNRGDVELQYLPNGTFAGFGYVTKNLEVSSEPVYVKNATLTLYQGLVVKQTGSHEYEGVEVKRNLFDSVIGITAYETGYDTDIRQTGTDSQGNAQWDITQEKNPPAALWYFDLEYDPTEYDEETGILYGLDDWGNRICMLDSETGMAYVTDAKGTIIVWPLDENGDKIISQSVDVYTDETGKQTINSDLQPVVDENGLPIYYKDGGVTWIENEWITSEDGAYEIARVPQGAYILEETAAPLGDGYVQSMAIGMLVEEISETQSFYMEDDYTKLEISKLDMTSRKEVAGAELTLYEAYRVYDDTDRGWHLEILLDSAGEPIVAASWVSDGKKPHWIDHIMPGDYILRETRVPTQAGYVTSEDVEVIIEETGEVQPFVMEDDHTAVEFLKVDADSGNVIESENPATLALYPALVNEKGEPLYGDDGQILYDKQNKLYEWQTNDGEEVRKTAHSVTIPGGHSYIAYDYDIRPVPGTEQAVTYVTETGAQRFEYLPVGKYVLVEEQAPVGYALAEPMYVPVLDVGSKDRVQQFTMEDEPIRVLLTKVNQAGGKEIEGATLAVYRAAADGSLVKHQMKDGEGNLLYLTDTEGNFLYDEDGELIPAMEYEESYLVDRWISGSEGTYTKRDEEQGRIPEGYTVGDLRIHELSEPVAGDYYFVEEQTPFGYVRAAELPFTITAEAGIQKLELVNELILGQLEIEKYDAENPDTKLSGARFKFTNLDTNSAVILITGEDGRAVSSPVPIGSVGKDGTVSLYHFQVQEVGAPDGYLLEQEARHFQFNVTTDRLKKLVFHYAAPNQPNKVVISKKTLTDKEELPGAYLEVRPVTEKTDADGNLVKIEGDIIDSWISETEPHMIKRLEPGEYVLIETKAPEGYLEAEKVYFTIKADMTVEEIPYVEMFDDDTKTEIRKIDGETNEALAGARLRLVRKETGETIEEWLTDETGTVVFQGLPAGEYEIQEIETPAGYQMLKEPVSITITKDYRVQTFVVENEKTKVQIEKKDKETREPVTGAVLQLVDETGEVLSQWTTGAEPQVIRGLKPGTYQIREIQAAEGYLLLKEPVEIQVTNENGVQTFCVTNQKLITEVEKLDKETGLPLPGASLCLIRSEDGTVLREWISTGVPEVFQGLSKGHYILRETQAPEGYAIAKEVQFEVTGLEEKQVVTLENEKLVTEFTKVDGLDHTPVTGAKLQLVQNAGQDTERIVKEWITDGNPVTFTGIAAGDYVIREVETPEGYAAMKDLPITIQPDEVNQSFTVLNQPIQVEIEKTGSSGKLLGGAILQLIRKSDGTVIREWESKADTAEHFTRLPAGTYIVREVKAPAGYKKMEPQEIEVKALEEIQEFTVKNYKITHSGGGGGGGHNPGPEEAYMELYKVDGATGERLANAAITVYRPDGSVYYEGVTGPSGTLRFEKPGEGTYTFQEVAAPDGYYLNETVYQFTITPAGAIEGDTELFNYKKGTVIISKEDVTTAEELPGAVIEITDSEGNKIFEDVSDEHGKVYFEVPAPGVYHFREVVAPDGYELNETVFTFTVFEDGSIIGNCTITDQKHYGRITAEYETKRQGEGDLTIGDLLRVPKTGDSSNLGLFLAAWAASAAGLLALIIFSRKRNPKHGRRTGKTLGMFLILGLLLAGMPAKETLAAESGEVLENLYEEHQYTTTNPDSDEAEKLFEKELERDGVTYRLSEIHTEVLKQEGDGNNGGRLELTTSPFLEEYAEKHQPDEQMERDGLEYRLAETRLEETKIPAHEVTAEETVTYDSVEALDRLPSAIPITVTDEATGQTAEISGTISAQEFSAERWEEGFSFQATFHEYGLDGYWLGEQVFTLAGDEPDFAGYEAELLSLIGADSDNYTVEDVVWDGETYEDTDGVLCRDARISGKKLVRDCAVTYQGTAVFPEEDGVRYLSSYEPAQNSGSGIITYTMKATGVYKPKKNTGLLLAAAAAVTGAGAGGGVYAYRRKRKKDAGVTTNLNA